MASKEANINTLYSELSRYGQSGEYERGLKTANKSKFRFFCVVIAVLFSFNTNTWPYVHRAYVTTIVFEYVI